MDYFSFSGLSALKHCEVQILNFNAEHATFKLKPLLTQSFFKFRWAWVQNITSSTFWTVSESFDLKARVDKCERSNLLHSYLLGFTEERKGAVSKLTDRIN